MTTATRQGHTPGLHIPQWAIAASRAIYEREVSTDDLNAPADYTIGCMAHIIAQHAPDLLAALIRQVKHTDQLADMVNGYADQLGLGKKINAEDWTDQARAAIAKAEGRV